MIQTLWRIAYEAGYGYFANRLSTSAAAMAFYTMFALGPIMIFTIAIAEPFVGRFMAQEAIFDALGTVVAPDQLRTIRRFASEDLFRGGGIAALAGAAVLLYTGTRVFVELDDGIDAIWRDKEAPSVHPVLAGLKSRLLAVLLMIVLGVLLIVLFAGGSFWELFPLRGLTSDGWSEMSWPQRIVDYLWHLTLPLVCMTVGAFAVTTMLTKNAFIEEIRKQYVLVALAKGLSERSVLWRHVLRNAMIPLVTGFPAAFIGAFFAGSVLIETLFSLDGLGLLAYESVVRRDYPVVMGSLYLFTLIGLAVKLVADVLYVVVDPRVQFGALQR